jgi:hypothetical protein
MNTVTRRLFLTRGSLTVAAAGIAASVPGMSGLLSSAEADAPAGGAATSEAASSLGGAEAGSTGELTEPLVAHVKDLSTGEISIFMGEHEYTYRDPQMAAKLLQAAR